jgi:hypothetical protein
MSVIKLNPVRLCLLAVLSAGVMFALPAAARAQEPGDASHQKAQAMAKAVTDAVYAMPQYTAFSNVDFHISADGTVVLTGMAASKELKSNVCSVIERVDGVTECTNNLYQLGVARVDRELRAKIYDSIYGKYLTSYTSLRPGQRATGGNRFMGPHPIHIVEDKQHVSLYGWVNSEEDKASAAHAAKVVPGVADVKNYLRVVPAQD